MKDILYGLGAVLLLALAVIWGLRWRWPGLPAEILHSVSVWVKEAAGMKLSKFANLVKNGGRCAVLHVAGSGIWLSTGTAIYRATELPDMEGSEQVRTVLDMTADAWKKVYLTEDWRRVSTMCWG